MAWGRGLFAGIVLIALTVGGCAIVDQYSGRAIVYNLQAEQAQQQQILLNVVRASLRRPMQFTGLQTITGTASASGNFNTANAVTSNTPYISLFNLTPPSSSSLVSRAIASSLGAGGSISGGPTFTVPVLDTQEFYQGLLTPISGQLLDLFLQSGYPRDVLFNLVLERIIIKRSDGKCRPEIHTPDCELIVRNYVLKDVDLDLFQSLLGYFIAMGLNTEPVVSKEKSTRMAASTSLANSKTAQDDTLKLKPFAFCFSPRDPEVYSYINHAVLCGDPGAGLQLKASEIGRKAEIAGVPLTAAFMNRLYDEVIALRLSSDPGAVGYRNLRAFAGKKVSVAFHTRSIEEILYYLGEVVRRQAQSGGEASRFVHVRIGPPQNRFPLARCPFAETANGYVCKRIFVVNEGAGSPAGLSVNYNGAEYSIPQDTEESWSMPVLDVVKQLLAINTSAKQLPASNLISVISNQ